MFANIERFERIGMDHVQNVVYAEDKTLFVEFEMRPELQAYESEMQGRPVYKNVLYTIKRTAGDNKSSTINRTRMEADRFGPPDPEKYPSAWKAYKNQTGPVGEGIPLSEWPLLTKADVLNLRARNVHTVEALAALTDLQVQNIGLGGLQLREKAKAYIGGDAEISRIVADKAALEEKVRMLEETVSKLVSANQEHTPAPLAAALPVNTPTAATAALSEELQKTLDTPPVRRPGRPPKNQEN